MKRLLLLLTLAVAFTACGNSDKSKGDPNSPVAQYISLTRQWLELTQRDDYSDSRRDQMEKLEGQLEGLKMRCADYKITEADRRMLTDFLEKDLPKYGRHASSKDYRIVEGAITLADLE